MSCISQNKQPTDIEDLGRLIHNQRKIANKRFQVKDADKPRFSQFATELCSNESLTTKKQIGKYWHTLMRKYHITPSKTKIRLICKEFDIGMPPLISDYLIKKKGRSMSGIVSIGVSTKPLNSCSYKCSYCPTPLDSNNKLYVPKSYDETEGAIARGLRNHWKGHFQIYERGNTLTNIGHIMDKLEIIVRGGTFHCYSEKYQIHFITELYYGANTFYAQAESEEYLIMRKMLSLEEEIEINKGSKCRVIGLTLETRPDFAIKNFSRIHLNPEDNNRFIERRLVRIIRNLRRFGCTRIEFGIQHTDNAVLEKVKRESTIEDAIYIIKIMKDCCFKIVGHWMPDLPGSNVEMDYKMMKTAIQSPDLQLDDWKIYPTATTVNTEIYHWHKNGDYTPYSEKNLDKLIDLCIWTKTHIPKWVRIDRLTRDIPSNTIETGYQGKTNLRQIIQSKMKKNNQTCNCLRCKEVKDRTENIKHAKLVVTPYKGSGADDYFISYESCSCKFCWRYYLFALWQFIALLIFGIQVFWGGCKNYNILYGFCRLRLSRRTQSVIFPELENSSLVRELKVYGRVVPHFKKSDSAANTNNSIKASTQHTGFGRKLMRTAEIISRYNNYRKISVINGVGTEEYYVSKLGYKKENNFVSKTL